MSNAHRLRGSLYVPATHKDLLAVASGAKWPELRSMIFCTEDAVASEELEFGLENLSGCLERMPAQSPAMRFVRVRNPDLLARLLTMAGVEKLDGFVFPKFDLHNAGAYMEPLRDSRYLCMPTLETRDVFDSGKMIALRDQLLDRGDDRRILALRIGGNDLLAILGIRRPRDRTIYRTPLGHTIAQIVTVFKPFGFQITAPVFEHIDCTEVLMEELSEDIAHGLCGKTAIHPSQVPVIEASYRVSLADLETARRILMEDRAVFKFGGSMCELATHRSWARQIVEQTSIET